MEFTSSTFRERDPSKRARNRRGCGFFGPLHHFCSASEMLFPLKPPPELLAAKAFSPPWLFGHSFALAAKALKNNSLCDRCACYSLALPVFQLGSLSPEGFRGREGWTTFQPDFSSMIIALKAPNSLGRCKRAITQKSKGSPDAG